ncbi:MAG: hypothetical protein N2Z21_07715 [Candidatus Sumerlaeaceae bacterium]|nr:hypothetical protein [Candidatus Sumerlaeaceae bacterium]
MKAQYTPLAVATLVAATCLFVPCVGQTQETRQASEPAAAGSSQVSAAPAAATSAEAKEAKESDEPGEEKVSLESVPAAVRQAIEKEAGPSGKIVKVVKESEEGKEAFEADFLKLGAEYSIKVAPDGAVVEIEKKVDENTLPAPVKAALQKAVGKGKVLESLAVTMHLYEFEVEIEGKAKEVKIDPLGNVEIEDEPATSEEGKHAKEVEDDDEKEESAKKEKSSNSMKEAGKEKKE